MSRAGILSDPIEQTTTDPDAWNAAIQAAGGHMLQSWQWGAFKDQFGWLTERIAVETPAGIALAQVLFRQKAGVSIGYIPRGPAIPGNDGFAADELWDRIARVARRRRALTLIVEPDQELPRDVVRLAKLSPGPSPIQPSRTVKVPLVDDNALLAQMHQKTRYNVRLAQRRDVTSRFAALSDGALDAFYELLADTSSRNDFGIHPRAYYGAFLRHFGNDATLIFAEIDGRPVAGVIAARFGDEAIYMYGGSSTKDRAHGAGFFIQYEAMRWAREQGCSRYDLWGIPPHDPTSTKLENGDRIAGTSGSDWRGLYEFKTRFGGEIISYQVPLERQYHPVLASVAKRLYRTGIGA